jgi:hypothetical protein
MMSFGYRLTAPRHRAAGGWGESSEFEYFSMGSAPEVSRLREPTSMFIQHRTCA